MNKSGGGIGQLIEDMTHLRILVIGDVMIDSYIMGKVERISPEAPVQVLNIKHTENRLGGAANVALNLIAMGAKVELCALTGYDAAASDFELLAQKAGICCDGLVKTNSRKTTQKSRVIAGTHHLIRLDAEDDHPATDSETELLKVAIGHAIDKGINAIVFEDYDKGCITPELIDFTVTIAKEKNIPIAVDPKYRNFYAYKGVTLFKPNFKELTQGLKTDLINSDYAQIAMAAARLREKLLANMVFVTLSEHGVLIDYEGNYKHAPAHLRKISDVSGAGDTVIAVATIALALGLSPLQIAELSNLAGGLVCQHPGVVPIDINEWKSEIERLNLYR